MLYNRILAFTFFCGLSISLQASEKEAECLAKNIYYEARDQGIKGKIAVGLVTLNRVKSSKYPETICRVVWQNKQFSWTHDGKSDNPYELDKYEDVKKITKNLLENIDSYQDFTEGSLYYHTDYISPCWSRLSKPVVSIKKHVFYNKLIGSPCIKN